MSTDNRKSENESEHHPNAHTDKQENKIIDLPLTTTDQDAQKVTGGQRKNIIIHF
jgi:hypothetical protein